MCLSLFQLYWCYLPALAFENTAEGMKLDFRDVPRTAERCNLLKLFVYYVIEYNFHTRVNFVLLQMSTPYSL